MRVCRLRPPRRSCLLLTPSGCPRSVIVSGRSSHPTWTSWSTPAFTSPYDLVRPSSTVTDHSHVENTAEARGRVSNVCDEAERPLQFPSKGRVNDPSAWADLVEKCLNDRNHTNPTGDAASAKRISDLILQARRQAGVDVLGHIGVQQKRWDVVVDTVDFLLVNMPIPDTWSSTVDSLSSIKWPSRTSLEDVTQEKPLQASMRRDGQTAPRLDDLLLETNFGLKTDDVRRAHDSLGQIWQTLGTMILTATNHTPTDSDNIMPRVLQILAKLHRHGFIPHKVYETSSSPDASALQQPPHFHTLSSTILSALSDAEFAAQTPSEGDSGANRLFHGISIWKNSFRGKPQTQRIASELWLEFTLWCCVHGGWLKEGVAILREMKQITGDGQWSLICWRDIMRNPDEQWARYAKKKLKLGSEPKTPKGFFSLQQDEDSKRAIQRTVSSEVIVAFINGMIDMVDQRGSDDPGYALAQVIECVKTLKAILERDQMGLGTSTWDSVILRLVELPGFNPESTPKLLESVLELTETYGREGRSLNSVHEDDDSSDTPSYVFDGTAAIVGLYHRTLEAHIRARDIHGALRVLSRLQSLTDENKRQSLKDFFKELKEKQKRSSKKAIDGVDSTSQFPGIEFPNFFLQIPVRLLADLLDLATTSGTMEVANWMVYSNDVDGPIIHSDLYNSLLMAPALVRFAAAADDTQLLTKVFRAHADRVARPTLFALYEQQLASRNWNGATKVLQILRAHSLQAWTLDDYGRIIRTLLGVMAENDGAERSRAVEILQKLLRGDLASGASLDIGHVDTLAAVVTSINPLLAKACSGLLYRNKTYRTSLTEPCFNIILEGVVKSFGSEAGKHLWQTWCTDLLIRDVELASPDSGNSAQDQHMNDSVRSMALFEGHIKASVKSIRIIIQQAIKERDSGPPTESPSRQWRDTLQWAADELSQRFSMDIADVDFEVDGLISATTTNIQLPYSGRTIQLWVAMRRERKQWALFHEDLMRRFAVDRAEEQMKFQAMPAMERAFLHSLALDLGLSSQSVDEESERAVVLNKTPNCAVQVPATRIDGIARDFFADRRRRASRSALPPNLPA